MIGKKIIVYDYHKDCRGPNMGRACKQKVLLVHNYYKIAGGEDTVVANEKKMLEKNGHTVFLYKRNNEELGSMSIGRYLCFPFTMVFSIKTYWEIKKLIIREHIDIVHVHNTLYLISPSVYYAAHACKVPVVQTIHNFRLLCPGALLYRRDKDGQGHICEECLVKGIFHSVKNRCYRNSFTQTLMCALAQQFHRMIRTYQKVDAYICLSSFGKSKLSTLLNADRIYIKPNYAPDHQVQEPISHQKQYYLYMGRIEIDKGIPILLEAFSRMPEKRLVIAGIGTYQKQMLEAIEVEELEHVEYRGFCTGKEKEELLQNASAMIVPSQWYEGMPMTIIESYSYGTPVIASDLGTLSDIVEDGYSGFKFQYNSASALVDIIHQFENSDIQEIQDNCRRLFKEKYSEKINYHTLMEIYRLASEKNEKDRGVLRSKTVQ